MAIPQSHPLVVAFIGASGITYVATHKWNAPTPVKSGAIINDKIEGVSGLVEGEVVTLPQLTSLTGETVNLGNLKEERLLCVFVSTHCPGCIRDADLWRDLNEESAKRGVPFYLIHVSGERADFEAFSQAYSLSKLPILFDQITVGPRRLDFFHNTYSEWPSAPPLGRKLRHYDKQVGAKQLANLFQLLRRAY
jgi:peroxiredoxin